ncbi:MAG: hypothetical protein IIY21_03665 [Clostridiales bacterium]|jgi:hypothetical protein|nr:hypothetical protein [Oscillospiraceae bacterium]MBQ1293109.1 hypothetical protein [Clostridiales bacterium]MBQ1574935.1 hypothetical protein [Clostridiales bacterium]MBQ5768570.1 hypothetical protein [Clostridiales bacterium]
MRNYDDIINLSRPQYHDLPPMSIHDRAAQFSPFAALVGYDAAVEETARLTDSRREMEEDEINELNRQLSELNKRLSERPRIRVTYFIRDRKKEGGRYASKIGNARTIDQAENRIIFTDGESVPVKDMYSVVFIEE